MGIVEAQTSVRAGLSRIDLRKSLVNLIRFLEIPHDDLVIMRFKIKSFLFTNASTKLVGFGQAGLTELRLNEISETDAKPSMGHGKVRIQFDGVFIVGNRGLFAFCRLRPHSKTVGLQRFERGSGGFPYGRFVFLDGSE